MGVFSTLATLFLFGVTQADDFKKKDESDRNRGMAKERGMAYYLDGHGKTRSCETDELVYVYDGDPIRKVVGVKSGRVYYYYDKRDDQRSRNKESLRKRNEELENQGKKYRIVNVEKWNGYKTINGIRVIDFDKTYVDLENGKKINLISLHSDGMYHIWYMDEDKPYKAPKTEPVVEIRKGQEFKTLKFDERIITKEEYMMNYFPIFYK